MFIWLSERLRKEDKGFTLIELMVVVLIIAILIAIAIPTFLGARRRAQDRQAQSNLRNGLTAEKTYYADAQTYTIDETATGPLVSIETNLAWGTDNGWTRGVNVMDTVDGLDYVTLRSFSRSGQTFCILDRTTTVGANNAGTWYDTNYSAAAGVAIPAACATADGSTAGWSTASDVGWRY